MNAYQIVLIILLLLLPLSLTIFFFTITKKGQFSFSKKNTLIVTLCSIPSFTVAFLVLSEFGTSNSDIFTKIFAFVLPFIFISLIIQYQILLRLKKIEKELEK